MNLGLSLELLRPSGFLPVVSLSASSIAEDASPADSIGTLTATFGTGPYTYAILTDVDSKFAIGGAGSDELVVRAAASFNYETAVSHSVTVRVTDSLAATEDRTFVISVTDVADFPTVTGAASTLAVELAGLTVDVETTFDLRDIVVSPTSQTLTFDVNFGAIDGDGFTWRWTPSYSDFLTYGSGAVDFILTATDTDLQELEVIEDGLSITDVNEEPQYAATSLVFEVPEGSAPQIASAVPPDDAAGIGVAIDPSVTFDRHILLGATGNFTSYNVTGAVSNEVFDLATEVGSSPGQVEKTAVDTVTMHMTADFATSTEYATQFSAGAVTNLGGIPVAALTDTTTISFTTASGAAAPAQITAGQWSLADPATGLELTITINTLPDDGGSAILDLEYNLDGGSWSSLGGTTTGSYAAAVASNGVSYAVRVRATNAIGNGTSSPSKSGTATDVPAQFAGGDWSIADAATSGDATVTITTLPSANGATITDIEAQIDGGSWVSLGISTTTTANLAGFTDTVESDVAIRAVNSVGNGTASATKPVTTTAASGGITEVGRAQTTGNINAIGDPDISGISMQDDDVIIIFISASSAADRNPSATGYTVLADIRANDAYDAHTWVGYLRVSGTPPTSVPLAWGATSSASAAIATAVVLRGVHTTTLEDVTSIDDSGPNTALISPSSITPSTVGAWIMTFATSAHNLGGAESHTVTGGEYDTFNTYGLNSSGEDVTTSIAIKEWASGAFAPTAWGFSGTDSLTFSRGVITIAVRPA